MSNGIQDLFKILDYEGRKALKESELERLAYNGADPLDVMIYLQSNSLFWY